MDGPLLRRKLPTPLASWHIDGRFEMTRTMPYSAAFVLLPLLLQLTAHGSAAQEAPLPYRINFISGMTGYKQCSDGILNPGEECDDGNLIPNDGCSADCKLESATLFLCVNVTTFGPTECCPARINPITSQQVCDCKMQASDNPGYTISADCRKVNINECFAGTANCHKNAACEDRDATLNASLPYECVCPPGMVGDGVASCDLPKFQTQLKLEQPGTTIEEFDEAAFKQMLYDTGAVPSTISPDKVFVSATESGSGGGRRRQRRRLLGNEEEEEEAAGTNETEARSQGSSSAGSPGFFTPQESQQLMDDSTTSPLQRRLLQASGLEIKVTIYSDSEEVMSNVTSAINITVLQGTGFVVLALPTSYVNPYQDGTEPTVAVSAGFKVTAVQFDDRTGQWLVDVRYTPNVPNTITSLYISKPGTELPYPLAARNTYYISKHPCVIYNAVCCLNDYKAAYEVGTLFGDQIASAVGACNSTVQGMNTLGMFDPAGNDAVVDGLFAAYPDSSVQRLSASEVRLRIAQTDLSIGGLAMRSQLDSNPAGYQLSFFVGMTYLTLLEANAMSVSATQTSITLAISNSISFSFSSSQDYSLVKYVTLNVMQNKWIDGLIQREMQFVQMGFVLPAGTRQNMETGLVPLTSVRFAIARSLPDRTNASLWTNPCFSGYGRGMYDSGQGYRTMYRAAASQPCAADYNLCMNPLVHVLPTNLVNFYFPIGDRTLTEAIINSPEPYSIYVMFQISTISSTGKSVVSNLFARAVLNANNVISLCESVTATSSLLSTTQVDVAVGFVGTQTAWDSSMVVYRDVTQAVPGGGGLLDTTKNYTAPSLSSALITVVLKGSSSIFSRTSASDFYLDVEQLSVIHFLDATRFNTVVNLIRTNQAYTIALNPATGRPVLEFSQNVTRLCAADSTVLSCALHTNIYDRATTRPFAVHTLSTGINTTSLSATRDWLMANILKATDEYSFNLSTNMTHLLRRNFDIDDRIRKAWFVNPGNRWTIPMTTGYQSDLLLSDRLIVTAVITLNDGGGNILRRRLMSFASSLEDSKTQSRRLLQRLADSSSSTADDASGEYIRIPLSPERLEPDEGTVRENLQQMEKQPRTGTLPPFQFNVDIPKTMTEIYDVGEDKSFSVFDFVLYGRFDDKISQADALEQIGNEFLRRLQANMQWFCPTCERILPVFNNLQNYVPPTTSAPAPAASGTDQASRRRHLLQTGSSLVPVGVIVGSYSIMLIYRTNATNQTISLADVQRAVYTPNAATLPPNISIDPASMQKYWDTIDNDQFIIGMLQTMQSPTALPVLVDVVKQMSTEPWIEPPATPRPYRPGVAAGTFDVDAFVNDLEKSTAASFFRPPGGAFLQRMALVAAAVVAALAASSSGSYIPT